MIHLVIKSTTSYHFPPQFRKIVACTSGSLLDFYAFELSTLYGMVTCPKCREIIQKLDSKIKIINEGEWNLF